MESGLAASGWHFTAEGLSKCQAGCTEKGWPITEKNVVKIALDLDLRAIADSKLPRNLADEVKGPLILQLQKVKNVAVSSRKQHLSSPNRRLLRLYLADGQVELSGIEIEGPLDKLSPVIPPGTKVKLRGTVKVQNGLLLLTRSSLEVLGGQVEHLLKKWNLQKIPTDGLDRSKTSGTDGPPLFTAFSIDNSSCSSSSNRKRDTVTTAVNQTHRESKKKGFDKDRQPTTSRETPPYQQQSVPAAAPGRPTQSGSSKGPLSKDSSGGSCASETDPRTATRAPSSKETRRMLSGKQQQDVAYSSPQRSYDSDSHSRGRNRGERRQHRDEQSRDSGPSYLSSSSSSRGRGSNRGGRSSQSRVPYERRERDVEDDDDDVGGRGIRGARRGRGRMRREEGEYEEQQRPKKSYDLADFLNDKLKLSTTTNQTEYKPATPNYIESSVQEDTHPYGKGSSKRDTYRKPDYYEEDKQRASKQRGRENRGRRGGPSYAPREAWFEEERERRPRSQHSTTTSRSSRQTHTEGSSHQSASRSRGHNEGSHSRSSRQTRNEGSHQSASKGREHYEGPYQSATESWAHYEQSATESWAHYEQSATESWGHYDGSHQTSSLSWGRNEESYQSASKERASEEMGHWDWVSGSGGVPYSARKQ